MSTILVVDDRAANRKLLFTLLGHRGHRLLEAVDGAEALAVARTERPDLVITDILLPTMDGYELVRQLRADPAIAHTRVVFHTAHYHEQEAQALAHACGVSSLLTEPAEPEVVLRTVEVALGLAPPLEPAPAVEQFDREHLRLLTDQLSQKANELSRANQRLSALVDLGLQLGSELEPSRLLKSFCHAARDIIGARYAIAGIVDGDRDQLRYLFTSGMNAEIAARLGSPNPRQGAVRTILGEERSLRQHNPGGDPVAAGFSSFYPPVHAWLGTPIVSSTRTYGWLALIDKVGFETFGDEDERLARILAAQVGRIYQNGSLYADMLRQASGLQLEVSECKQAEQALQESHSLLKAAIEAIPEIVYVKDRQGRYLLVSSEAARFVGKPREEIIGRDDTGLLGHESARRFMEVDRRVMESGEAETYEKGGYMAEVVNRTYLTTKVPFRSTHGELIGVLGISRDITEPKRAEEELKREKEILQTIFNHIPVMIRLIDPVCRVRLVNRHWEEVLGWSLEEARNHPDIWAEFNLDPECPQQVFDFAQRSTGRWVDFKVKARDGRTLDTCWASIRLSDGARIEIGQDITERKREEQVLEQYAARLQALSHRLVEVQEEERRHLARELHDEVGQLLTCLNFALQTSAAAPWEAAGVQLAEARALLGGALTRVRELAFDLRPALLDHLGLLPALRGLIERFTTSTGVRVNFKQAGLERRFEPELETAAYRIVQEALTNIARHAQVGEAAVRLWVNADSLEIQVEDQGVGYDPEAALTAGRSSGLPGMQERVLLLGGRLVVESAPGGGTHLLAELPLAGRIGGDER